MRLLSLFPILLLSSASLAQNRVLELDGQGSYVELPAGIFDGLEAATVEAWVKWDERASFAQFFAFGTDDQWRAMGANHFETSSTLQFFIYTAQHELHLLRVSADLPLGQWCHLAVVSGRGGMRWYLNGVQLGQNGYEGSLADIGPGLNNYLGKSNWQDNAYFHGQLDEVRVWSTARTGEQIRAGLRRRLQGDEEGLVALWNFDAGHAQDLSPSGHHGRLRGAARCEVAPFPDTGEISEPSIVAGSARDAVGVPLTRVVVGLRRNNSEQARMVTNADGRYALAVFGAGTYTLDAMLEGAIPQWMHLDLLPLEDTRNQTREVALCEGQAIRLDLTLPASEVARWPAEGDARDVVGHYDGELMGGASFAPGLVGQAFSLDGVDDFVQVRDPADLGLTGSFSLVAWVLARDDRTLTIFSKWEVGPPEHGASQYNLRVEPGQALYFAVTDEAHQADALFQNLRSSANVLTRDVWNQVVAVYDQATGTRHLYVNGREVSRRQDLPITLQTSDVDLALGAAIGYGPVGSRYHFKGLIDEATIYRRALPDVTIQRLYAARAEARWQAEGDANDTRGGNHGTLVNDMRFAPGIQGQAFSFDGQGSHVEFGPHIGNYGTSDFTIELWLWRTREDTTEPILVREFDQGYLIEQSRAHPYIVASGSEVDRALGVHVDAAGHLQVEISSGVHVNSFSSKQALSPRAWHHMALVRQGVKVSLYIDGKLDTRQATEEVIDVMVPAPLRLGTSQELDANFGGLIDGVALHNRALAPEQIRSTYDTTFGAWRWRLWKSRLETGGIGLVVVLALLSSARYYTQRRAGERERRARQLADAANQAKSVFLANMSHEIRTPMNAILGYAQILRDYDSLSQDERQRAVEAIHTSGDHLLGLINDVLDLSRIESGRLELTEVDFDLVVLMRDLGRMFELRCQQRGLTWQILCPSGANWVRGDNKKLRQVLVNLLGNAIKFTAEGHVQLEVTQHGDGQYTFSVSDSGVGVTADQQESIFAPFARSETAASQVGTGLGLAIARQYVERMGGRLEVVSAPGEGSRFFFSLLLPDAPAGDVRNPVSLSRPVRLAEGQMVRALVVDDIATNRDILKSMLRQFGAAVEEAASGAEALERARIQPPDIVFLDSRMPDMDGEETLTRLRQQGSAARVVVVTASVLGYGEEQFLRAGFDAFVGKPFRREQILNCLHQLLGVALEREAAAPEMIDAAVAGPYALPRALAQTLRETIEAQNATRVSDQLDQLETLGEGEQRLAGRLRELLRRYDMDGMLDLLNEVDLD